MNTWKISGMLIVYWPITIKFRTREQTSKPQTNYRCCLRFRYLAPHWFISRNTITFHKYFWCSRFCEFHSQNCRSLQLRSPRKPPCVSSTKIRVELWLVEKCWLTSSRKSFPSSGADALFSAGEREPKKLSGHSLGRLGQHIWERL